MPNRTVLLVDDEESILSALKRLLRKEDYRLLIANGGPEALAVLEKEDVQVVITDQRMPDMSGAELLQKVKELYPRTVRIILSGYADVGTIIESINAGEVYRFVTKPWNDEELRLIIRQCFVHYDLVNENRELLEETQAQKKKLKLMNARLEEMLAQRSHTVQLAHHMLTELPVGVLGVSLDGTIVLANKTTRRIWPELALGTNMTEILPPFVIQAIGQGLEGRSSDEAIAVESNGNRLHVRIRPFNDGGKLAGCMLTVTEDIPCKS